MFFSTGDDMESETSSSSSLQGSQPCRHFDFSDIQLATDNFDESLVIGRGGFGKVYKGNVINGSSTLVVAAIKRLDSMSSQGASEFRAEVDILSNFRHCNLVSLIGYCNHGKEMILVYEYMPNGTLEDHLHKLGTPLSWLQRLNICIGAARGLHYLHTGTGIQVGIIHRDVKTSNILLHESWAAKISDFGLSRIGPTNQPSTYVNTLVKGTFGYLDPDYFLTGRLTRKSDVYAFGVVLLEVLCRKRAVDVTLDEEQWNLARWAQESIKKGNLKYIIDSNLKGQISPRCLKEFVRIADRCLHNNPKKRSTMAEVVVGLESVLALQEKFNSSLQHAGRTIFDRMVDMIPFPYNGENSDQGDSKISSNTKGTSTSDQGDSKQSSNTKGNRRSVGKTVGDDQNYKIQSLKQFKFADLERATSDFSHDQLVGEGGFGGVFLGWVDKNTLAPSTRGVGIPVAVKRLKQSSNQGPDQWQAEVSILGRLAHPNIITLLGYCNDKKNEYLIVYECMQNQSFDHFLYPKAHDTAIVEPLSWGTRLSIMIGVAQGLAYLHLSEVILRGVKSSAILLDQNFNAKLGDFGLARSCSEEETSIVGTFGYIDPHYIRTNCASVKSDIYGFGVVLLETLTGLKLFDMNRPNKQQALVPWAIPILAEKGELKEIIDPRLEQNYPEEGAFKYAALTLRCLADEPNDRPSSDEVLQSLKKLYADSMLIFGVNCAQGDLKLSSNTKGNNMFLDTSELPANYKIQLLKEFKFADLKRATNNFSQDLLLGRRGYGRVFLGWVNQNTFAPATRGDGIAVAVKRLDQASGQGHDKWQVEVSVLTRLIHPNIIRLLGCCNDKKHESLLVYEYMQNQSFNHFLYGEAPDNAIVGVSVLSWETRLSIMIGVAQGLTYLHLSDVMHRDVKSSSIFLDQNFNAKLGDFGLARSCSEEETSIVGTFGYIDPHYIRTSCVSVKSDIYGFGVVLLETLTGLKLFDMNRPYEQQALVPWAIPILAEKGELKEIIDPRLEQNYHEEGAFKYAALTLRCLADEPNNRPSSDEVLQSLKKLYADSMLIFGVNCAQGDSKLSSNTMDASKLPADDKIQRVKELKFADLKRATNNFSPKLSLGEGVFGDMFLGWVDKTTFAPSTRGVGIDVAVKRLHVRGREVYEQWQVEVSVLGRLIHPNIVRLLGCCNDKKHECLLVYEYMQNKSFERFLSTTASGTVKPLSWGTRLTIMIGVAQGLTYLHLSNVIHRDVKSSSIFLDQDFNAKLGGFGLARSCLQQTTLGLQQTTGLAGTYGYLDPHYVQTGKVSVKSDIYGFGVVLLETLTGLKVWDFKRLNDEEGADEQESTDEEERVDEQHGLVAWAVPILADREELRKRIDPRLQQNYPEEGAFQCVALAVRCLAYQPKDRPSSDEVLQSLKQIYADNKAPSSYLDF